MNSEVIIWTAVVALLALIFFFRMTARFRNNKTPHRFIEFGDDYAVFDYDDEILYEHKP